MSFSGLFNHFGRFSGSVSVLVSRSIHLSSPFNQIQLLTRLRVVDNSPIGKEAMLEGRPPRTIHVYNKTGYGYIGDKVMVAIKGQKRKGILVGCKQNQKPLIPKFDSNNIVLIEDNGKFFMLNQKQPLPSPLRPTKLIQGIHKETKIISIHGYYF
nr:EOG090X0MX9 [Eurycercus lamellatus]